VAPVWLKDVGRIEALLGIYFFAVVLFSQEAPWPAAHALQ